MIETINGKAYVKKGDKVYEVGGGGTNFIFADSEEELPDPSTVPEDTVALVPSSGESGGASGGGGLPVVELTTYAPEGEVVPLSEAENTVFAEAYAVQMPVIVKYNMAALMGGEGSAPCVAVASCYWYGGAFPCYSFTVNGGEIKFLLNGGAWYIAHPTAEL